MSASNAKNLSYNKQEPSFLRKLREQHGGDRHNVQITRPKKDRLKTGDGDEDEPTIVDEKGDSLGKEEWEAMLRQERGEEGGKEGGLAHGKGEGKEEGKTDGTREKQQVAEIGTSKKRKMVKVVGDEDATKQDASIEHSKVPTDAMKSDRKDTWTTAKKKAKKIKLSFDEPDGG